MCFNMPIMKYKSIKEKVENKIRKIYILFAAIDSLTLRDLALTHEVTEKKNVDKNAMKKSIKLKYKKYILSYYVTEFSYQK